MRTPHDLQTRTGSRTNVLGNWLDVVADSHYTPPTTKLGHSLALEQQIERRIAASTQALERVIARLLARQQQLEVEVNHDSLTGLANRKLLHDRFQCTLHRAKRSGDSFALLMIDLNGFKAINDIHGHAAGDEVLETIAHRLQATLRTCDTAARLGGDEFVVLVESIHDTQEVSLIGHKIARSVADVICLDSGAIVTVGVSIGLALYPDDGLDMAQMLHVADRAMYECKSSSYETL